MCQMLDPVKPLTCVHAELRGGAGCVHHLLRGALAHALGVAVAPDVGGRMPLCRSSIGSQTACPTRWLLMA